MVPREEEVTPRIEEVEEKTPAGAAKEEEDLADIDDKPTPSDVLAADILLQDEGGDEAFL